MTYKEIKKHKGKKFSFLNEVNGYLITGKIGVEYCEDKTRSSLVLYCDDEEKTIMHFWYSENSEIYLPEFKIVENKILKVLFWIVLGLAILIFSLGMQQFPEIPREIRFISQIFWSICWSIYGWKISEKCRW